MFDLVYDATDIPLGNGLVSVVRSNHSVVDTVISELHAVYANDEENIMDTSKVALSFFYSTIRKVINSKESFRQKLEDLFGKVNPPKTIKSNEVLDGDLVQNKEILEFIVNDQNKRLSDVVNGSNTHIWLISEDGVLVIGTDIGHPTLVKARAARIGGEIKRLDDGSYKINDKSNRYSSHHIEEDKRNI